MIRAVLRLILFGRRPSQGVPGSGPALEFDDPVNSQFIGQVT